jgi:diguanylate cyclase (GGDEF)-like protein
MSKEKILIVEDNKALSKLIVKKMNASLDFDIVAVYSFAEAKALVEKDNDFFVALLDLNLPDAPDGEVVDMVLEHKIPSIILTGSMDKETRESILKKDVIDYVVKGNIDDVNYIFTLIERLHKNRGIKVLVVDDSIAQRAQLKELLKHQMFTVMVAAHGEEALVFLEDNPDIKLVLTDFNMPVIDGLELTKEIRKRKSKNELPIIAMTASNKELISAQFLKIGANDFINKPFTKEELACRINNSLDVVELLGKVQQLANHDFLTNISNRRHFFECIHAYMAEGSEPFALCMLDIDNFKTINDTFGHDVGDNVIVTLAKVLKDHLKGSDIVARFGGEEFCVVLKNVDQKKALEFFFKLRTIIATTPIRPHGQKAFNFTVSMGVTFSDLESVDAMLKHADKALYKAKQNGKNRVEVA